ncbi:MAG: hypothetical protein AAGA03_05125 [Planctomycetota bacterium]
MNEASDPEAKGPNRQGQHDSVGSTWLEAPDGFVQDQHSAETNASQLFAHGLLVGHFETPSAREQRIQAVLARFDEHDRDTVPTMVVSDERTLASSRQRRWFTAVSSLAATLLLVCSLAVFLTAPSADAAVHRAIQSLQVPVTRVYDGVIRRRLLRKEHVLRCELFSQSIDRFAAVFVDTHRQPCAVGSNGRQRWLVYDDWTWTSDGQDDLPRDLVVNRLTVKHMQFNALLTRIPRRYKSRLLAEEPLPGESAVMCRPIEATLKVPDSRLPETIRIWSHPSTGVVTQMHVIRNDGGAYWSTRIEVKLIGERDVADDFFEPRYHLSQEGP